MARPTTGIRPVDDLIGGLRVGDNVIWETEPGASVDPFVAAFVRGSRKADALAYVSFHTSPNGILARLGEHWNRERFLLVDCFTDGFGRGEPTFLDFYRSRRARGVRIERVPDPGDSEAVHATLADIERDLGRGARYVFDSLTGMQELWGTDATLSLFLRSCPRLYDLGTVAYWLLERDAHDPAFLSKLAHVTQVVLDVRAEEEGETLKVYKAEGRPPEVSGRKVRFRFEDGQFRALRDLSEARERMGQVLRSERIRRRLTQAELARRIGISPSALSQAERGLTGLSGQTLTRATEVLGLPFLPAHATAPGHDLRRRGARQTTTLVRGLIAEEVAETRGGASVRFLAFAPGASGRRPPFATKLDEVVVVLSGVLEMRVGMVTETLHAGDALLLHSEPADAWRNPGPEDARVLWLIVP